MAMPQFLKTVALWFDNEQVEERPFDQKAVKKIDWVRIIPFLFLHLACFAVIWVGWSPVAVLTAAFLYCVRMFAITGFYHRYFSHKTFKTSRVAQFIFAVIGMTSVQRGPLWWAAHHRNHHKYSDQPQDAHSPRQYGFWWAHIGWITNKNNFSTRTKMIPDLTRYPELVFLNRYDLMVPVLFATLIFLFGKFLQIVAPHWGTSGAQMLVWGFFISTVFLFHSTSTINSLSHRFGRQRFQTGDDSRNNLWLAFLTFGEGWHNNHHQYPATVRQGFYWYEVDLTFYVLKFLSWLGIIWDLKPVPSWIYKLSKKEEKASDSTDLFPPLPAMEMGK